MNFIGISPEQQVWVKKMGPTFEWVTWLLARRGATTWVEFSRY
jgi:hypothetical protein